MVLRVDVLPGKCRFSLTEQCSMAKLYLVSILQNCSEMKALGMDQLFLRFSFLKEKLFACAGILKEDYL